MNGISLAVYMYRLAIASLYQKEHLFLFLLPALASYWLKDLADRIPTTRKTNKTPLTLREAPAASQSSSIVG